MRKYLSLLVVIFLPASFLLAQKITNAVSPESVGFSSERLKRLDTSMTGWANRLWVNGAVGLVIKDGKIVYYKAVPETKAVDKE